jgi:hypothetical protein
VVEEVVGNFQFAQLMAQKVVVVGVVFLIAVLPLYHPHCDRISLCRLFVDLEVKDYGYGQIVCEFHHRLETCQDRKTERVSH